MVLRSVVDFDDKQWGQLQKNMKRGPTEKQVENLKKAQEHVALGNVTRNF